MTTLHKPVTRRAEHTVSHRGRRYVVQLAPGLNELVRIKEEGCRTWYNVPLSKIFALGARIEAESRIKERKAKRRKR